MGGWNTKEQQQAHYFANKDRYVDSNQNLRRRNRRIVRKAKATPCADCGVQFPYFVMQFDHVRGVKEFGIANISNLNVGLEKLIAEIAKCDVVCGNCHAFRTHERGYPRKPRTPAGQAVKSSPSHGEDQGFESLAGDQLTLF